jgi:hypothetical protein
MVMKCLEKNPDRRPQSMTAIISELETSGSRRPRLRGLFDRIGLQQRKR